MHFENLPSWALPVLAAILGAFALAGIVSLVLTRRQKRLRQERWRERRIKSLAHLWSWDWIMRRDRMRRLTDQRSESNR